MLELAYTYSADGLVKRIVETDAVTPAQGIVPNGQTIGPIVSQVDFTYDNRNRLTRETRMENGVTAIDTGPVEYDLSYTYDAGGNRLTKTDNRSGRVTAYTYDITEINDGGQHNNRLLGYDVTDTDPASGASIALEQTLYEYGAAGNVVKLVRRGDTTGDGLINQADTFAAVWWFYYDTSNKLWLAVSGTGMFDETAGTLTGTMFDKAAEYRYDSGRQRYLVRQRDPNNNFAILGTDQWRDYAGDNIYNDYTVDATSGTVTNGTGYLPGIGFDDPSMADSPAYYGADLIGTTRRVVDSSAGGTGVSPVIHRTVLTALGEPISSVGTGNSRFSYAGAWGYETPEGSFDPLAELGWQHVGARYYDPAVGCFMQRDPIGILGGSNTYIYVWNEPTALIDPGGLITVSVGLDAGFIAGYPLGLGGVAGINVNYGFSLASGFTCSVTATAGAGYGMGLLGGAGANLAVTTAPNVRALTGPGIAAIGASGSGIVGPVGSVGAIGGTGYVGGSVGGGVSAGPGGLAVVGTATISLTDSLGNFFYRHFGNGSSAPPGYRPY